MSAMQAGLSWLVVVGVLTSILSLFYYARIIMYMFMEQPAEQDVQGSQGSASLGYAFCIMFFAIIFLGVYPSPIFDIARLSFASLNFIG